MGAMAIGAFGARSVAQSGQLAVHTDPVLAGQFGMAVTAAIGLLVAESDRLGVRQIVSLVAVSTARLSLHISARCRFVRCPARTVAAAVDTLLEPFFNESVTFRAGRRNIRSMKCRQWIVGSQDLVCSMAVRARGSNQKPRLHQAVTVNAFQVLLPALLMTTAADLHLVVNEDRRTKVVVAKHIVFDFAVALVASEWRRSTFGVRCSRLRVHTRGQSGHLFFVTLDT